MKKLFYTIVLIALHGTVHSQEINGDTIVVLKGGISYLHFSGKIQDFEIEKSSDYSIEIENERSVRIWPKVGVSKPSNTRLFIAEGKRNHFFALHYKEKGNFNATSYNYTNLSNLAVKLNPLENETIIHSPKTPVSNQLKKVEQVSIPEIKSFEKLNPESQKSPVKTQKTGTPSKIVNELPMNALGSTEKKLADEKAKLDQQEKLLAMEIQKRMQKEMALIEAQNETKRKAEQLKLERLKRLEAAKKMKEEKDKLKLIDAIKKAEREAYTPPPAVIDIRKKFPAINFLEPPIGQFFEGNYFGDTSAYHKASQFYLMQPKVAKYKSVTSAIDQIGISLHHIHFSGEAAYFTFNIENSTNHYFIMGATLMKILDIESGKNYQLNPYYISSFPIIEGQSNASFVYVMKPEQNISSNSFVILSIRDRQTNAKLELQFPGTYYTDALKSIKK